MGNIRVVQLKYLNCFFKNFLINMQNAGVVELVDTPDLGSGGVSCGGSSPSVRTIHS